MYAAGAHTTDLLWCVWCVCVLVVVDGAPYIRCSAAVASGDGEINQYNF